MSRKPSFTESDTDPIKHKLLLKQPQMKKLSGERSREKTIAACSQSHIYCESEQCSSNAEE